MALQQVIRVRVSLQSIIHSDGWRTYDGLVDLGYKKLYWVNYLIDEFVTRHISHQWNQRLFGACQDASEQAQRHPSLDDSITYQGV